MYLLPEDVVIAPYYTLPEDSVNVYDTLRTYQNVHQTVQP